MAAIALTLRNYDASDVSHVFEDLRSAITYANVSFVFAILYALADIIRYIKLKSLR